MERGVVHLETSWTKNRKPGFQYLPASLLERLKRFAESGMVAQLYRQFYWEQSNPLNTLCNPLLYVPSHTAREMDKDLDAAGIPKRTAEGNVDFHVFRSGTLFDLDV